jgi:uncharacterized protein YqeY
MSTTVTKINADIITAMKARDSSKVTTLRMVKAAFQNKAIDKQAELDETEAQAILSTMVKQRKDSFEQFTKGGRPELAEQEAAEIKILEVYMPEEIIDRERIGAIVDNILESVRFSLRGEKPGPKSMGVVMSALKVYSTDNTTRIDGKILSEIVRSKLQ